jgi:hypothetical protein
VINGFVSLAIPALLKGDNGYEFKEDVCTILFDTVIEWAKENPESALKTVKFVIDPKDGGTINVNHFKFILIVKCIEQSTLYMHYI